MAAPATHTGARPHRGTKLTALAAADFALSAGFGTTASVSAVEAGSTDLQGRLTVASAGTGQAANPTCTLTFKDGAMETATFKVVAQRQDTAAAAGYWAVTSKTATTVVFTFVGTPVAAQSYILEFLLEPAAA